MAQRASSGGSAAHRLEPEAEQRFGGWVGRHDDAGGIVQDQTAVGVVHQQSVLLGEGCQRRWPSLFEERVLVRRGGAARSSSR